MTSTCPPLRLTLSAPVAIAFVLTTGGGAQALAQSTPKPPAPTARTAPASQDELSDIAQRGRLLAEYDRASWLGTDAAMPVLQAMATVLAQKPDSPVFYVADKVRNNWVVSFGRLNDARDEFHVFVEAVQRGKEDFRATKFESPKVEKGRVLNLARAMATGRATFKSPGRPYNFAVIAGPKDGWYVYALPAQTDATVFPIGGDVRYTISPDGNAVLETRQMHLSVLEFKTPTGQGPAAAMVRTAIMDDAPEDSDVFFAMTYKPSTVHLIVSKNFVYAIRPDGQVRFVAKTADFVKK